jgi:hypothetical protein
MKQRMKLLAATLAGMGIPGVGEIHMLTRSGAYAPYAYWTDLVDPDRDHTSLVTAEAAMTTGRNDVLLVSPDNHSQAAAVTWDLNCSHMVGMSPPGRMNMRSRIGHSANFTPLLTVSGYGNSFHNIYFMHGRGNAANLNCLTVSGDRNSFIRCHFLPASATEFDTAGYKLVTLNCGEGYFYKCFFGGDTVAMGATDLIRIYGASDRSCRVVFEDCIFLVNQDAGGDGNFIETVAGNGSGVVWFLNCQFVNIGTSMTLAIDGTGLGNQKFFFDSRCVFANVGDIVTNGKDTNIYCGFDYGASADESNLIAGFPDHTA